MANEVRVGCSLQIKKGYVDYQSRPTQITEDMDGEKGPCPGAVLCSVDGTDIDFSELTTPGPCRLQNLDDTNYVEWGIYDPTSTRFFPVGILHPGKAYVIYFSPNMGEEYADVGTGTVGINNRFRIKAHTAACNVLVEAFEA